MNDSAEFLWALVVEASRFRDGRVRLHVRRRDVDVDYGFVSQAEFGFLLEELLSSADE